MRYALAPAGATFAALVEYVLLPDPSIAPFVFFYFSVALVAWAAGRGPGLLTVLLSAVMGNWLYLEPFRELTLSGPALTATLLFGVGAGAVALICAQFRDALLEAQRTAAQLRHQAALLQLSTDAARESEARFRTLADNIAQIAWMLDEKGDAVWFNERWYQYTGVPLEDARGQRSQRLVHPDHVEHVVATFQRSSAMREPWEDTFPLLGKDGTYRWFLSRAVPIRDEQGKVVRWFGTNTDVTEQRNAEEALRESEEQLRLAKDAARMGSWGWNIVTGEWVWSDRCKELFNLRPDTVMTYDVFLEAVHAEDRERVDRAVKDALAARTEFDVEMRIPWLDGPVHWVASKGRAFYDAAGEPVRAAGMALDITERKRAEEALRIANERFKEADQRKNEFLGVLSHELRNPLSPIQNSLYIAGRAAPGSEKARRALAVIDRQVHQLTRIVDDLLDVTRIARGKVRLQRERVELQALASQTAEDYRILFEKNGLELEVMPTDEPLFVNADPIRLTQIIGNLLHNAAKFTPRGSRTTLSTRRADERFAELSVQDRGDGIAPDVLANLFEPFVQAEKTLERSAGGLGLGLALVKGLVELHGGSVSAHSAGPGRGATFVLRIPVDEREAPRLSLVAGPTAPSSVRRVLVVEDNIDAAETLKEALELNGHAVELAYTGSEGIQMARAFKPDVVLCDIGLPGMNGFEVARVMRADPDLRSATLIALSGYALPEDVDKAKAAGFDLHLAKPPDLFALERSIAEARAKAETA